MTTGSKQDNADRYWKRNLRILFSLLAIWWLVSFGAGVVATVTGNPPPGTQPPPGWYFTHAVGSGATATRHNEVVIQFNFKDDKAVIGQPETIRPVPHVRLT